MLPLRPEDLLEPGLVPQRLELRLGVEEVVGRVSGGDGLLQEVERDALDTLRGLDLETLSPVDAFMWLVRIKRQLRDLLADA